MWGDGLLLMANEDIKKRLEQMNDREKDSVEREKLVRELHHLEDRKWSRDHPRMARLLGMLRIRY